MFESEVYFAHALWLLWQFLVDLGSLSWLTVLGLFLWICAEKLVRPYAIISMVRQASKKAIAMTFDRVSLPACVNLNMYSILLGVKCINSKFTSIAMWFGIDVYIPSRHACCFLQCSKGSVAIWKVPRSQYGQSYLFWRVWTMTPWVFWDENSLNIHFLTLVALELLLLILSEESCIIV